MASGSFPADVGLCAHRSMSPFPVELAEGIWINKNETLREESFCFLFLN